MHQLLSLPRDAVSRSLSAFFRTLGSNGWVELETDRLDGLTRERLEDMGIPPRTEANMRHSGQKGSIPQASLW